MATKSENSTQLENIWFTRCAGGGRGGVPTASGIAYKLGWLQDEFRPEGIELLTLQENAGPELRHHHYEHGLPNLIREGGNLFAIPAKAQRADTRLIGLTWIDEGQSLIVRRNSPIHSAADLEGRRLGLPAYRDEDIAENRRGRSITRHGSLAGYKGALESVVLTLDDVKLIEIGDGRARREAADFGGWTQSLEALEAGIVDAVYVKGAAAADGARKFGFRVGVDLDKIADRRYRVNNGTPRPITVHQAFIDEHYDVLVRFLAQTLRAAQWAKTNLDGVRRILQEETGGTAEGVAAAYRDGFQLTLAPDVSKERVELFRQQKNFQLAYGILDRDFDFDAWIDPAPLADAERKLTEISKAA